MRCLIFEPDFSGHRLNFVRYIVEALSQNKHDIILATSQKTRDSDEYGIFLKPIESSFVLDSWIENRKGVLAHAMGRIRDLRQSILRAKAEHVFIPSADGMAQILGFYHLLGMDPLPKSIPVDALLLRGNFAYDQSTWQSKIKANLGLFALRHLKLHRLFCLDPFVCEYIQEKKISFRTHLEPMPDPVECGVHLAKSEARQLFGIPSDARVLGCAGVLDERKGIDLLIQAYANAKLTEKDCLFLIGRMSPSLKQKISEQIRFLVDNKHCIIVDRFVADQEFTAAIDAMDVVCTPYPRHIGSASIVIRAAAANRPVLGSDYGWIHYAIIKYKLGWTCDVRNNETFATAISKALNNVHLNVPNNIVCTFIQECSISHFQNQWISLSSCGQRT